MNFSESIYLSPIRTLLWQKTGLGQKLECFVSWNQSATKIKREDFSTDLDFTLILISHVFL